MAVVSHAPRRHGGTSCTPRQSSNCRLTGTMMEKLLLYVGKLNTKPASKETFFTDALRMRSQTRWLLSGWEGLGTVELPEKSGRQMTSTRTAGFLSLIPVSDQMRLKTSTWNPYMSASLSRPAMRSVGSPS